MDERRAARLHSETEATSVRKGQRRVHSCRNISRLGCMISDGGLFANTGDDLEIELLEGIVVPARVIWARQGHVGLAFKREIDPATVRHLAAADEALLKDMGLRSRVGRFIPDRFNSRAA